MPDSQGNFYSLCHSCPCGSGLPSDWCKDERGEDIRACDKCKEKLLHQIFTNTYLDMAAKWRDEIRLDLPPLGYEWQWEDLLKEKGCEQVVGLENAKRRRQKGQCLIADPNGDSPASVHRESFDLSAYILIPEDYAARVLAEGRLV